MPEADNRLARRVWGKLPVRHALSYLRFLRRGRVQHLLHQLKYQNQRDVGLALGRWYGHDLARAGLSLAGILGVVYLLKEVAAHGLSLLPVAFGAVGVLLGVVAIFLLSRNMAFLVGEVADPLVRNRVLRWLLERPEVLSVSYLHLEYVGPEKLFVVGAVDLAGDERESEAAVLLQRVEDALLEHPRVAAVVLSLSNPAHAPLAPESQNTRV